MTDTKIVRFAAVLVVLAGYVFVFRAGEERIGDRLAQNAQVLEQLRAGERSMASHAALESERAQLLARLRGPETAAERSALVATFLRDAAATATARRTTITAITASGAQAISTMSSTRPASATSGAPAGTSANAAPVAAAGASTASAVSDEPFDGIPLELTLEGRYADVLATVRALSAGRVPASIELASLARKSSATPDATLTAALRVVLQRLVLAPVLSPTVEQSGAGRQPS
ncbi:MAG TPA: hypothetical protein VE826_12810 [Dongiaceae bacterium]|nr:hypothetical protein [Dongiaceae bacterium]